MSTLRVKEATVVAPTVLSLPSDLSSPSLARRSVEQFLAADHRPRDEATDAVLVIASELVTNAIVHGSVPVVLSVSFRTPYIAVEVSDGDPRTESVRVRAADDGQPGGRGLRIVAVLADRWGARPSQHGKTVWATKRWPRRG